MKQEPVAWMIKTDQEGADIAWDKEQLEDITEFYKDECWEFKVIPLYTAPRQLSDFEIKELAKHYLDSKGYEVFGILEFARAILKKAREK